MNEVAEIQEGKTALVDEAGCKSKAVEYLNAMGMKLPEKQQAQFLELCGAFGLNPFKREIYAVGYGDNLNIIVGFETYIKRAERIGRLDGWEAETSEDGNSATCTIWRKDWTRPFKLTVYREEYDTKKALWQSKPRTMLRKVAIAQAFRQCFSDDMGGLPYTEEEMATVIPTENVTPKTKPATQENAQNASLKASFAQMWPKMKEAMSEAMKKGGANADSIQSSLHSFYDRFNEAIKQNDTQVFENVVVSFNDCISDWQNAAN